MIVIGGLWGGSNGTKIKKKKKDVQGDSEGEKIAKQQMRAEPSLAVSAVMQPPADL